MNRVQQTIVALCAFLSTLSAGALASEYRISPGETVEINITSMAERSLRAVVQTDGTISLPEIGSINIAGLTPAEFQARLEMVLPTKLLRVRAPGGKLNTYMIAPIDITSAIVTYRPVYVTGDILTPGEQSYRPLMSARQAITVAGGYSQLRGKISSGSINPADLTRDYQSLWTDYTKAHYHRERIKAEMNNNAEFDLRAPAGSPISTELAVIIGNSEKATLNIALEDGRKEQAYLQAALQAAEEQIATLAQREKVEAGAEKADEQDLAKVLQLVANGNQTNARVAEVRRFLMLTSSRRLATLVELMHVRTQRLEYGRQIEKAGNQKKIELLNDLRDTNIELANIDIKLRTVRLKLQVPSASTASLGVDLVRPVLTIVRKVGNQWQQLTGNENTELLPGDVLEVQLCAAMEQGSSGCPREQTNSKADVPAANKVSIN